MKSIAPIEYNGQCVHCMHDNYALLPQDDINTDRDQRLITMQTDFNNGLQHKNDEIMEPQNRITTLDAQLFQTQQSAMH